jgi:hypothetical protein
MPELDLPELTQGAFKLLIWSFRGGKSWESSNPVELISSSGAEIYRGRAAYRISEFSGF